MKTEFKREYKGTKIKVRYPIEAGGTVVTSTSSNMKDAKSVLNLTNMEQREISNVNEVLFKREKIVGSLEHLDYRERGKVIDTIISLSLGYATNEIIFLAPSYLTARRVSNELFASIIIREKRQAWMALRKRLLEKKANEHHQFHCPWGMIAKKAVLIDTLQRLGKRKDLQYLKRIELIFKALGLMGSTGAYPFMGFDTYPCHFAHVVGIDLFDHVRRKNCPIKPKTILGDAYEKETIEKIPQVDFIFLKSLRGVHDLKKETQWKQLLDQLSTTLSSLGYWVLWRTDEAEYEWNELLKYLWHNHKEVHFPECIQEKVMSGSAFGDDRFYLGNSFRIFQDASE